MAPVAGIVITTIRIFPEHLQAGRGGGDFQKSRHSAGHRNAVNDDQTSAPDPVAGDAPAGTFSHRSIAVPGMGFYLRWA